MTPALELQFRQSFNAMVKAAHDNSVAHGFWTADQSHDGLKIALMHSELSEALEAVRKNITKDDHIPAFSGLEAELADCVIRIMDLAGKRKLRLAEAIIAKHAYNKTRPVKHGGKKF